MRLMNRGRASVLLAGKEMLCAIRPLSGALEARAYGQYVQDTLRLLLPIGASIAPGDRALIQGVPYVCIALHAYPGHLSASLRRCCR